MIHGCIEHGGERYVGSDPGGSPAQNQVTPGLRSDILNPQPAQDTATRWIPPVDAHPRRLGCCGHSNE